MNLKDFVILILVIVQNKVFPIVLKYITMLVLLNICLLKLIRKMNILKRVIFGH